jgi:hypothetical protein
MGMLLAGGLLAVVLCGGGGLGGLVWFRPDLVARIPGLQGMTGPAPTPEEAMRSRVADLIDQGRDACEIRAALRLGLTVTTEGRVIPTEVPGMGAPRKVECLRSFLAGFKLQPAPTSDLRFAIEVAAQSR